MRSNAKSVPSKRPWRALIALLIAAGTAAPAALADAVTTWNEVATNVVVTLAKRGPAPGAVDMAYVHAAVYDAVNAIDGHYTPYAITLANVPPGASTDAAVAGAAYTVLLAYFPAWKSYLDVEYAAALAAIPNGASKSDGIAIGQEVASAFVAQRTGDGRNGTATYTPKTGPGAWQPTPPAYGPAATPWLAVMRPFTLTSPAQFRVPGPPALDSAQWAADYNEVKAYGGAVNSPRSAAQTEIGWFWTEHAAGFYNRTLRWLVTSRHLGTVDAARLYAQVELSVADALIGCFDSKYTYGFWRPVTAIRAGNTDGNTKTHPDPAWNPLTPTPGHPEYPSAHACAIGAFATSLALFFGTTEVPVLLTSSVTGTAHTVPDTDALIAETVNARVWGGMHYRTSCVHGRVLGQRVARWVGANFFRPR